MGSAVQPSIAVAGNHVELGKVEFKIVGNRLEKYTVAVIKEPATSKKELKALKQSFQEKKDLMNDYIDQINAKLAEMAALPEE